MQDRTRKTLNIALDHAQRAVALDEGLSSTLSDAIADADTNYRRIEEVIGVYGRSVGLLGCVIESIRREETLAKLIGARKGRRKGKTEREGKEGGQRQGEGEGQGGLRERERKEEDDIGKYREEDVNRLVDIHDSYKKRMELLSEVYGVPIPEDSTRTRL